jgi:hypothetical protein
MGIELSAGQQITMLLMLMVTSKGMAGVPRASLVVIAATLPAMGMEAGVDRAGARSRRLHGHGPHGNKRDRQLDRLRRSEMGRAAVRSAGRSRPRSKQFSARKRIRQPANGESLTANRAP